MGYFDRYQQIKDTMYESIEKALSLELINKAPKDYQTREVWMDAKELTDYTIGTLTALREADIDPFFPAISELNNAVSQLATALIQLDSFDYRPDLNADDPYEITDKNFKTAVDSVANTLRSGYLQNYGSSQAHSLVGKAFADKLMKAERAKIKIDNVVEQIKAAKRSMDEWFREYEQSSIQQMDTLKEQEEKARELLLEIGTSKDAVRFSEESKTQYDRSNGWLVSAFIIASGLLIYVFSHLEPELMKVAGKDFTYMVPLLVSRVVALAIASIGIFFCLRNYSACRHNATVNTHRANALSTFRLFRDGTDDDATKNAILLETTKVIFSPSSSGYLKAADEGNPGAHVIEIFRNISGKSEG